MRVSNLDLVPSSCFQNYGRCKWHGSCCVSGSSHSKLEVAAFQIQLAYEVSGVRYSCASHSNMNMCRNHMRRRDARSLAMVLFELLERSGDSWPDPTIPIVQDADLGYVDLLPKCRFLDLGRMWLD